MIRTAEKVRKTKETDIKIEVNLDGNGVYSIATQVGFLKHMLETLSKHSLVDLKVEAKGDLAHHVSEDVAITLGEAIAAALGDRVGIRRFGSIMVPMDDVLASVAIDLGGRPYYVVALYTELKEVEGFPIEDVEHFLRSFAQALKMNLHARVLYGKNDHHKIEAIFKGLALSLRHALSLDPRREDIPSSKGIL